ncbi:hypothetical protein EJD97_015480 [Solanum chilense]|nr:hypothetical protein EJD97_015480 [Solanum chilense]
MARTHGKIHLIHAPHSNLPEERYALSPLKLLSIPKDEAIYFYVETLCQPGDPDHKWVVCPGERDALLLIALTHMLNSCFMRSSIFQEQSCGFPRDRREFFAKLGGVGKIITIFILNLAPSQGTIPHKRILRKLAPLVRDSYVISLVSSFLKIPMTKMELIVLLRKLGSHTLG